MQSFGTDMLERRLRAASGGRERRESESAIEQQADQERAELEALVREADEMAGMMREEQEARRTGGVDYSQVGSTTPSYLTPREYPSYGSMYGANGNAYSYQGTASSWDTVERQAELQYRHHHSPVAQPQPTWQWQRAHLMLAGKRRTVPTSFPTLPSKPRSPWRSYRPARTVTGYILLCVCLNHPAPPLRVLQILFDVSFWLG